MPAAPALANVTSPLPAAAPSQAPSSRGAAADAPAFGDALAQARQAPRERAADTPPAPRTPDARSAERPARNERPAKADERPAAPPAKHAARDERGDSDTTASTTAPGDTPTDTSDPAATASASEAAADPAALEATLAALAAAPAPAAAATEATPPATPVTVDANATATATATDATTALPQAGTAPAELPRDRTVTPPLPEHAVARGLREPSAASAHRAARAPALAEDNSVRPTAEDTIATGDTPFALAPEALGAARHEPRAAVATPATAPTDLQAAAALQAPARSAAPAATLVAHVPTPVGHAAFAEQFGQRVQLMIGRRASSAELTLSPQELGPVQVSLEVRGQEATLLLQAVHPATRAALEEALPRLRDMFAQQGLQLTDAQVGQQSPDQAAADSARRDGRDARAASGFGPAANATDTPPTRRLDRLIDVVA